MTTASHIMLIECSVRQSTPAGKARSEDPLRKALFGPKICNVPPKKFSREKRLPVAEINMAVIA